jgi:hypothetical protein
MAPLAGAILITALSYTAGGQSSLNVVVGPGDRQGRAICPPDKMLHFRLTNLLVNDLKP